MVKTSNILAIDKPLFLVTLFLIGLGLVQVYSSSFIYAIENYSDGFFFFKKQLVFSLLSIVVLVSTALMPWRWMVKLGLLIWVGATVALALTLVPGLGVKVGGATRWLQLPFGFRVEPAEFLKVTYPFIIGLLISLRVKNKLLLNAVKLLVVLGPFTLLLNQPDFGSLVLITLTLVSIFFVFGMPLKQLAIGSFVSVGIFASLVLTSAYRMARVKSFLNPWADPTNSGFQVIQSMLSVHEGGFFGKGLGQGQAKLFFLPEAHTDFTFAIFAEEWGFIGVLMVMVLYGFLIFRGLKLSALCQNPIGKVVSIGITTVLALGVFVNMGVVLGVVPPKGLTLPFMSYGGSSIVATSFAIGVLLNISRSMKISKDFNFKNISGRYYKLS